MRALIAAILVSAALTAQAEGAIYRSSSTTVRLTNDPCTGIAADLIGEDAKAFRHATVSFKNRDISACWTLQNDVVLLVDDEGDAGHINASEFKIDGA